MDKTTNLKLGKPESTDLYSDFIPDIFGDNMEKIDKAIPLSGTSEIVVDTDIKKAVVKIQGQQISHITKAVMTLRVNNNDPSDVGSVIVPNLNLSGLLYRGDLYAVIQSAENIPQGTYYIDWISVG